MRQRVEILSGQNMSNSSFGDGGAISLGCRERTKGKLAKSVVSERKEARNSLVVSFLSVILIILALTGFVCTYKIQAEEECLSSKTLCYECDSRYDPNCADPFDLSSISLTEQHSLAARANSSNNGNNNMNSGANGNDQYRQQSAGNVFDGTNSNMNNTFKPKKMPNVVICHGCCVKITSKTPDGATYVKRTCTTNLQINYFMVGLVCMKESGDRGKMCFCETDYCNGQSSNRPRTVSIISGLLTMISLLLITKLSSAVIQEHISIFRSATDRNINNHMSNIGGDSGGRYEHPTLARV